MTVIVRGISKSVGTNGKSDAMKPICGFIVVRRKEKQIIGTISSINIY